MEDLTIRLSLWFALVCLCASVQIQAGQLPDSAKPGAVQPEVPPKPDIPEGPPSGVLEVPPVIDRPFEVDECPCVRVTEFRLLNAEDLPKYGIELAVAKQILQQAIGQQPPVGFSIGQIQQVANRVRRYYREQGLILTQVVVPVQTVEAGIVELEVLIGKLGRILVEGNAIYSEDTLNMVFKKLIGQPVHKDEIEAALLRLTDFPGLTAFGVFQPGQAVGSADLVLKVQDEDRFDLDARADNHGTRETGRNRVRFTFDINNFSDNADVVTLDVQRSYTPKNYDFLALEYSRYFSDGSYRFNPYFSTYDFDVGGEFAASDISAKTKYGGIQFEKSQIRSRLENLTWRAGLALKNTRTFQAGLQTSRDRLTVVEAGLDYDLVDSFSPLTLFDPDKRGGGINLLSIEYRRGIENFLGSMGSSQDALELPPGSQPSRQGGPANPAFAPGKFDKIFAYYTRLQTLTDNTNLLIRGEYQWSPDLLVPIEQYFVGGPDNVRAFPVAQQLWDRALFFSAELLVNLPFITDKPAFEGRTWGQLVQLGIFYDMAVGRLNSPLPAPVNAQTYQNLNGAGVGLRFTLPGKIEARFFSAWELGGDPVDNDKQPQLWGDITISF